MNAYSDCNRLSVPVLFFNLAFILFVSILQIIGLVLVNKRKIKRLWKDSHYSETIFAEVIANIGNEDKSKRSDIIKAMKKGAVEGLADRKIIMK